MIRTLEMSKTLPDYEVRKGSTAAEDKAERDEEWQHPERCVSDWVWQEGSPGRAQGVVGTGCSFSAGQSTGVLPPYTEVSE